MDRDRALDNVTTTTEEDPPLHLRAGDVVECGIDGLGRARQRVVGPGYAP